jgi:hypothetical protein
MISSTTTPDFWKCYRGAPTEIQQATRKAYQLWRDNPQHPSLHFKPVGNFWSVRITRSWRALGRYHEGELVWFWMGSHGPYERKMK